MLVNLLRFVYDETSFAANFINSFMIVSWLKFLFIQLRTLLDLLTDRVWHVYYEVWSALWFLLLLSFFSFATLFHEVLSLYSMAFITRKLLPTYFYVNLRRGHRALSLTISWIDAILIVVLKWFTWTCQSWTCYFEVTALFFVMFKSRYPCFCCL
jgi:hypothetical protein